MKYLLISPREPSGATWLINCLLELGIKTYRHQDPDWMWHRQEDGSYILNPEENILCKWLPILSMKKLFFFRDDIEVQWTHEWPIKDYRPLPVIYFIRDPRDSIHSRYKRESPKVSFADFLDIPDTQTLLHKIDNWVLFNLYWIQRKNLKVFRFEDYKQDASHTLNSILEYIKFNPDPGKFQQAIAESTSDKARESENEYRESNKSDKEIINRSGSVSEWKKLLNEGDSRVIDEIEIKSEKLLKYFGYEIRGLTNKNFKAAFYPNASVLPIFSRLEFSHKEVLQDENMDYSTNNFLIDFVNSIDEKWLDESKIEYYEIEYLLNNLQIFFYAHPDKKLINKIFQLKSYYNMKKIKQHKTLNFKNYVPRSIKKIIKKILL